MIRERLERSLHFAHNLQRQFRPQRLPDLGGYQVAAVHHSSLEMGGDFYDAVCLPNDQMAIIVGETSGHGLDAGFNVARTICEVRGALAEGMSPGAALATFNRTLVEESRRGCLVSMALVVVDSKTGRFKCTSAGNIHVCTVSPEDGDVRAIENGSDTPMGMLVDWEFPERDDAIPAGGALVIHTDGLVSYGSGLEPEALQEALARSVREGELVADSLNDCLCFHAGGELGGDDVTVVSVNSPG
jgi:serine phosphatase RsbU (regulator of sigma subunit)